MEDSTKTCGECGAVVYSEQLSAGTAGYRSGKLLCAVCFGKAADAEDTVLQEKIALVDEEDHVEDDGTSHIEAFGAGSGKKVVGAVERKQDDQYRRDMITGCRGATRCRVFHCKLADAAAMFMESQINEWADANDGIEIKLVSTCIGVWEAKKPEPSLIVTVFY